MCDLIEIRYYGFWDVPRQFTCEYSGLFLAFDSPFLPFEDEYSSQYLVYASYNGESILMGNNFDTSKMELVQIVNIRNIQFDISKRSGVAKSALESIIRANPKDLKEFMHND